MTTHSEHAADLARIAEDIVANPCNLTDDVARNVSTTLRGIAKLLELHGDEIKCVLCETLVEKAGFCEPCSNKILGMSDRKGPKA